ncbi:hypothetical protein ACTXT7_011222 [Hymenolepis weldensis]
MKFPKLADQKKGNLRFVDGSNSKMRNLTLAHNKPPGEQSWQQTARTLSFRIQACWTSCPDE